MAANSIRLTGLYSGFDTDAIVKSLMDIEQIKVDRVFRSKVTMQWKQEALNSVANDLRTFRNTYLSTLSASSMYSQNVYNVYDVTMTGSNTSAVTITAGAGASAGSHVINQVVSIAKASSASSGSPVSAAGYNMISSDNSTKLKDLKFANSMDFVDGKVSFKINDVSFTFSEDDTLQKLINTVNSNDKAGVTLNYSRLSDKFTLTSQKTGAESSLVIENITGNVFGASGAFGIDEGTITNGQDAEVIIDNITVHRSTNKFTIDGITYNLNETTAANANIGFTLKQNVDKAVEKIKGFVDAYNSMIAKLDGMLAERKKKDEVGYVPLTDAEKEAMSEKEIEKWEAIAKKGVLYNDSSLRTMLDELRKTFYTAVKDAGLSPSQIGIKTGDWVNKGQIALDENALRSALEKDPQQVMSIFTNISNSEVSSTKYSENGLLARISDVFTKYTKSSNTAIQALTEDIEDIIERIDVMEEKMLDLSEKYYKKYSVMETALSKMQSQQDWLRSMLGSIS